MSETLWIGGEVCAADGAVDRAERPRPSGHADGPVLSPRDDARAGGHDVFAGVRVAGAGGDLVRIGAGGTGPGGRLVPRGRAVQLWVRRPGQHEGVLDCGDLV